jgi:hypothetical protein
MKKNSTLLRELREELHYYQVMNLVTLRQWRAGVRKCKEIGAKMRALQSPDIYCTCKPAAVLWLRIAEDCHKCGKIHRV